MDTTYYGYKHWTLEEVPRCFYVGKGKKKRPYDNGLRSKKWKAVAKRYGLRIEICIGPVTDQEAIKWEIMTIAEVNTFTTSYSTNEGTDIGCNFTKGGDGTSGYRHSQKSIAQGIVKRKGKPGRKWTIEERMRASVQRRGVPKRSKINYGKSHMKPVQQLNEHGDVIAEFKSAVEARTITGVSCAAISLHCQDKRQLQLWRFKHDV